MLPNGKFLESKVNLEEPRSHCVRCDSVALGRPRPWYPPTQTLQRGEASLKFNTRDDRLVRTCLKGAKLFYTVDLVCFPASAKEK
jgi:hypothetical protein